MCLRFLCLKYLKEEPTVLPEVRRYKRAHPSPHCSRGLPWPTTPVLQKGARQNNSQFSELLTRLPTPRVGDATEQKFLFCRHRGRHSRDCPWPECHPRDPGQSAGFPNTSHGAALRLSPTWLQPQTGIRSPTAIKQAASKRWMLHIYWP